jgi:hypothetical protein
MVLKLQIDDFVMYTSNEPIGIAIGSDSRSEHFKRDH